jgi:hypothetical protein
LQFAAANQTSGRPPFWTRRCGLQTLRPKLFFELAVLHRLVNVCLHQHAGMKA